MIKKLISLVSVCSILATMVVGMANIAYASESATMSAVLDSENSTETVKYVNLYYAGTDEGIASFAGTFATDVESSISYDWTNFDDKQINGLSVFVANNDGAEFANNLIGTVIINLTTASAVELTISDIEITDGFFDTSTPENVVLSIPAPAVTEPEPVVVEPVNPEISVSGADTPFIAAYTDETVNVESVADIFNVVVTANDYDNGQITDLNVNVNGVNKTTGTQLAAGANVTIAVVIGYKGAVSKGYTPTITAIVE